MLHLTLTKGEYVMIGDDIRVYYDHNTGKFNVAFGIDAPREIPVVRSQVYEDGIAKQAAEGDREAMLLLEEIMEENAERRRIFGKRRNKRQFHGGRLAREKAAL